jgi:hypothetical protein
MFLAGSFLLFGIELIFYVFQKPSFDAAETACQAVRFGKEKEIQASYHDNI